VRRSLAVISTIEPRASSPRATAACVDAWVPVAGSIAPPGGASGQGAAAAGYRRANPAGSTGAVVVVTSTNPGLVVVVVVSGGGCVVVVVVSGGPVVVVVIAVVVVAAVVLVVVAIVDGGCVGGGSVAGAVAVGAHGSDVLDVSGAPSSISNRTLSTASVLASESTPIDSHDAIQVAGSSITAASVWTRLSPTSIVGPS
jgi:hypothetical protein